jgi:hypothetical protein
MSPYKLVTHALEFRDVVAKIQRALAANFGVPCGAVSSSA